MADEDGSHYSFTTPTRPPPDTPISNFVLFCPDSDDEEGDGEPQSDLDLGEDGSSPPVSRLVLVGDENSSTTNSRSNVRAPAPYTGRRDRPEEEEEVDDESLYGIGSSRNTSALSEAMRRRRLRGEGRDQDSVDGLSDTVMAVIWTGGKFGAAYYELETGELLVLPDTSEASPDFEVLKSIFRQILPRCLILNASQDEQFIKVATELCGDEIEESNIPEEVVPGGGPAASLSSLQAQEKQPRSCSHLFLCHSKLFSPEACKRRLLAVKLPCEPKNNSDDEHELFISSLLPFRHERTIRAAGALLQYLDKHGRELFQIGSDSGKVPVLSIIPCTMDDIVMVDDTAWQSLQVFSLDMHPSSMKQGIDTGSKEGLSVFGILKQSCCTGPGVRALRMMLLRPSRNVGVLNRRYDVVEYCCSSRNMDFTKSAKDCLKPMKNLPKLLHKLSVLNATVSDWKDIYQTLYHSVLLGEICSSQPQSIAAFKELGDAGQLEIIGDITREMMRVIDFEESAVVGRIVARPGIDTRIDNKKHQYSCLPEIMSLVAREEMLSLPGYIQKCSVVYIPEVGYLLCVHFWREGLTEDDVQIDGLEFSFKTNDCVYYKTPRTKELDVVLGDCQIAILEMETGVMIFLTERILSQSTVILKVGRLVAELDALLSMSVTARNSNLVRPHIVPGDGKLEIIGGRHLIVEVIGECVPNTTKFHENERVVILTGPNASGKSVYLKQVGVITIMALSGSFVPAITARIPTFDRLCTRVHAPESISTGLSSFMMDLSQMSQGLRTSTRESLLIIDEFGKGTAEVDGLSLLVSSVEDFLNRKTNAPTVFVSTHFNSMMNYLEPSSFLKLQSMKFLEQDEAASGGITYLYELVNGICPSSFAHHVAEQVGVPSNLIKRSSKIEHFVRNQVGHDTLSPIRADRNSRDRDLKTIANWFLSLDIRNSNPQDIMSEIKPCFLLVHTPTNSQASSISM